MTGSSATLMRMASGLLKALTIANLVCFAWFAGILAISFLFQDMVEHALRKGQPGIAVPPALLAVRLVMLIGMAVVPLAHILLTRLRAMVLTVREGDPFVAANAERLTLIAWSLLGIQFCDLAFGFVSLRSGLAIWSGWTFSLTGWLAVLLLFVLARVFDHGTRMRDELAGTI